MYIPPVVIKDGGVIHEGIDNVNVNFETVDGKGTFHVQLRTLYQNHLLSDKNCVTKIESKENPLSPLHLLLNLKHLPLPCLITLPEFALFPPRTEDALTIIKETKYFDNITSGVCDMAWVLLCMIPREVLTI